jgi:hypothetical protein
MCHSEMEEKIKKELNLERLNLQPPVHYGSSTKETFKACGKLVRAACVVLTFFCCYFHSHIQPKRRKGTENKGNYY